MGLIYMAPMLGVTDAAFRKAHASVYGGCDMAISPFVRTRSGERFDPSTFADLDRYGPDRLKLVPQVLTNQAKDFVALANLLFEKGYLHINLNMGCPVPTAAGRGQGAGLIPEVEYVDQLLDYVLARIPNKLSIKTRLGLNSETELRDLSRVLNRYPLVEVAIHARTARQRYGGDVLHGELAQICELLNHEVVFSGDINCARSYADTKQRHPQIKKFMLGRGLLANPNLANELSGGAQVHRSAYEDFLVKLTELYRSRRVSDPTILIKLKMLAAYRANGLGCGKNHLRALRKAKTIDALVALAAGVEVPAGGGERRCL